MSDLLSRISLSVMKGDIGGITQLVESALKEKHSAKDVLTQGLMPGMDKVGELMGTGEMFIPEVLLSARTVQAALEIIKPELAASGVQMVGKVVIGTVRGDLHTIGKNLVRMMLEGGGFEVIDLGHDVPPEQFVNAVKKEKPDIVGMSALLTTTMQSMSHTIEALKEAGVRDQVSVVIGGAPVTQDFADQIGADGYGSSAMAAVGLAKKLVGAA